MDCDWLLTTTRAVRRKLDLDRPLPDDVLLSCLRIAVQAPTAGASQSWRWMIVRDQARKDPLGALFRAVGDDCMRARCTRRRPRGSSASRTT